MQGLNSYYIPVITAILLTVSSCATTGEGGVSNNSESLNDNNSITVIEKSSYSLTDYLRRIVGVQVTGEGPNAQIRIRGKRTFSSNTTPLFVINGIRAGKNFSEIYNLINPSDIVEIEVLKGTDTSMYGMDGGNGVILISTNVRR